MMDFNLIKCAYIRGFIKRNNIPFDTDIVNKPLAELTLEECNCLEHYAILREMKLYYFKEKEDLPRVKVVLSFFKAIYPESVLEVGCGRGVFLFPLLRDFPAVKVTTIDLLPRRIDMMAAIQLGGIEQLSPMLADLTTLELAEDSFDVVTLLEVLEHIPNVEKAIQKAIFVAKRYIVVTVPSKEDDNPEHIHLLTKDRLIELFSKFGVTNLKFGGVNGHLFLIARKDD